MNRQLTGRIASYHFAPTPLSRKNLLKENVDDSKIIVSGNTVIDALHMVVDRMKSDTALSDEQKAVLLHAGYDTSRLDNGR